MRKLLVFLLLIAGGVWVYRHPVETRSFAGKQIRSASDYLRSVAKKWSPEVEPPPPTMLPEGTYVVRESISYMSPTGPSNMPVGMELRKIGDGNGKLVLSDGTNQVIVDEAQVTRDPHEVTLLKSRYDIMKNSLLNQKRARLDAQLYQLNAEIKTTSDELELVLQRDAVAKAKGIGISMATSPNLVRTKLERLQGQAAELRKQIAVMSPPPEPTAP